MSSDSSFPEPDDREVSSSDESPTEISNNLLEWTIKIRDDPNEDTDSTPLFLSSGASEVRLDTCERPAGEAELEAGADAEDSEIWESGLAPDEYTITELINTINCNKIALPDEAEVRNSEIPGDDNEDTSAAGYQYVKTRVDIDKLMNIFKETQWPLDLASGERVDPALKLAKAAKKAKIHQNREKIEKFGEERMKNWVSDEEKGKGVERAKEGEGKRKVIDVKAAGTNEEWENGERVKKWETAERLKQGRDGAYSPSVYSQ